eukprot:2335952-Amphidinium_carterae.1
MPEAPDGRFRESIELGTIERIVILQLVHALSRKEVPPEFEYSVRHHAVKCLVQYCSQSVTVLVNMPYRFFVGQ